MPAELREGGAVTARLRHLRHLRHMAQWQPGEGRALLWSFSYFFSLLCGYYIVRPMRDEMGIAGGVEQLQWMFTATFVVMLAAVPLFGWASGRFRRSRFLPLVYLFFILNLLIFYALFRADVSHAYVARAFFVWASVFNLFVVSVFWSFMADIFDAEQAKRLFGVIAAGGTAGAIAGPALTAFLVGVIGPANLLPISAACLAWSLLCIQRLLAWQQGQLHGHDAYETAEQAMGGSIWAGLRLVLRSPYLLGICLLMLLFTTLATFLYFEQAQIVRDHFDDPAQRTALFATMDLAVNVLTLGIQVLLTGRLVQWLGLPLSLALVPLLLALGFLSLSFAPVLAVLVVVQVLRRAGNYALMRPAREMLYVVLGREEKYKAKNFIDTVVYRGGDAMSAWVYTGLRAMGLGLSGIALLAVPLAGLWAWVAYGLGRRREAMAAVKQGG